MPGRKSWDDLSPAYRSRLERGGITASAYSSGASLSRARGHAHTPERPERAQKDPARYARYIQAHKSIRVITTRGVQTVDGLKRRDRSTVARHWNAVGKYLDTGKDTSLSGFEGVTVGGYHGVPHYELETRFDALEYEAMTGGIDYESIYEESDA